MVKKRKNKFLSFVGVVIVVIFASTIFIVFGSGNLYKNTFNNQQPFNQTYKSRNLKFTLIVPVNYEIVDNFEGLIIKTKEGKISVVQNGTNYSNLTDYLNKFDERRNLTSSKTEKVSIDSLEAISRMVKFPEENVEQKSYYIYINNVVYVFSTSSEILFDDLDKIAQSFKYTP